MLGSERPDRLKSESQVFMLTGCVKMRLRVVVTLLEFAF